MSNRIQAYINSSSSGRNRLPVPKKSFKSFYSPEKNISTNQLKPVEDLGITLNGNSGIKSPSINHSSLSSSRNISRTNSNGSLEEEEEEETRREAREAFLKTDHVNKRLEIARETDTNFHNDKENLHSKYNNYSSTNQSNGIHNNLSTSVNPNPLQPTQVQPQQPPSNKGKGFRDQDSYIGFANLPNQVYRKSVKKGFDFTLMLVGESGLGKSTLMNSLFLTDIYDGENPGPSKRSAKTVQVGKMEVLLKEGGVQLRLTIVDTPGFGDAVDNSECWKPILKYIDDQYDSFLNGESRVMRKETEDGRVHACLYFISPNGHGLKQLDIECMKKLHEKVNIIPIIAKADTMTTEECRDFKKTIMKEILENEIKIYEFPDCDDEEDQKTMKKLKEKIPFAVVGSNTVFESNGRKVRARAYPWGIVEVENMEHNDFTALRNMLIRTHLHDLKDVTNNVHYENFRYQRLLSTIGSDGKTNLKNPMLQIDEERREHGEKLKRMEVEMEQVFQAKVEERKNRLLESDQELQKKNEHFKRGYEKEEQEFERTRRAFMEEKEAWEEQNRQIEAELTSTLRKKKTLFN